MEISTQSIEYQQQNLTTEANNRKKVSTTDSNSSNIDNRNSNIKYNETSKVYFKLSEDISKYQTSEIEQKKQNQIDRDVSNTVNKYTSNNKKGFLQFRADLNYEYSLYNENSIFHTQGFSDYMQESNRILKEANGKNSIENLREKSSIIKNFEVFIQNKYERNMNYGYSRDFKFYNDEEIEQLSKENFKNTYSLSDNINEKKFNKLYSEYKKILKEKENEAEKLGESLMVYLYKDAEIGSLEKDYVIGNNKSKTEWLEHFDRYKSTLEGYIENQPDMNSKVKNNMQENIKYYENVISDLKELWSYGDLDLYS